MRGASIRSSVVYVAVLVVAFAWWGSVMSAQTLDALVLDFGAQSFKSLKNGMTVTGSVDVGDLLLLQECGDNPIHLVLGVNEATFDFQYANGYSFTASGQILVTSHENLPDNPLPFLGLSFLAHLRIDSTNQTRGKDWPRVGDDVIGVTELVIGSDPAVGEGVYRIVRPPAN
jgi:hypothetical protein